MLGTALGTTLMVIPNKYPPTKLVQIKSKGDYWFVQVTKPDDVYAITGGNKTARLSTKTKDKRQATSRTLMAPNRNTTLYKLGFFTAA